MADYSAETLFRQAKFLASVPQLRLCPADTGAEVAFCGRSNAGKSSALNALTERRKLARTSKTPGRTRHIVFFDLAEGLRLVDLPGYGYARVSETIKRQWQSELAAYLQRRQSLQGLVLLVDIRRQLTDFDQTLLNWCDAAKLPVHVLLTKADKLSRPQQDKALAAVRKALAHYDKASLQLFSATSGVGVTDAREKLTAWLIAPGDPHQIPG